MRWRWPKRIAAALLFAAALALATDALFPLPVEKLRPPFSPVVLDRDGKLLRAYLADDGAWRINKRLDELSPDLVRLVVAYEDRWFFRHPGVNPASLLRALVQNLRAGRTVSGGSTLTMQVARLIEPKPRTLAAKLVEAFRALQIEARFDKREILELYFNLAPYGGNLAGVGAGAFAYFGKDARELGLADAALLAALPNSPSRTRPDRHPKAAGKARDKLLTILQRRGVVSAPEAADAASAAVPARRVSMPASAAHAADWLRTRYPERGVLPTTLDADIQRQAEALLRVHVADLRRRGIDQAAAVVIDSETGELQALAGSGDFFDESHHGQVNGALAPRSPGSALKPFVYALAMDRGLATPDTALVDTPTAYGAYSPENFDGQYRGLVPLREALVWSLNVPAVGLVSRLGRDGLYPFLLRAGVTTLTRPESDYGLSMVLGGCEVNLLELSNLYAMLARGGEWRPVRVLADDPKRSGPHLISPGAAYLLADILVDLRRPDLPRAWRFAVNQPTVAWKTGTSYGHRDAWSIGYNRRWTVGVWAGNFSGAGAPELVGSEAAAPLLFAIFNTLPGASDAAWYAPPATAAEREICPLSGQPAGPA
ncbi:MAG: penicillin-binding protein 1C, partial [Myxococcales bacterium]